ncbi:MAG: TM1266 family iron-only hydrogenase system putative regulator [Lachnospiraceae bacterium]
METRVALIGIILNQPDCADQVNDVLHQYRSYIIGRMGLPYREKNISIISIVVDAPGDIISAISGKLGMIKGASAKAVYSKS